MEQHSAHLYGLSPARSAGLGCGAQRRPNPNPAPATPRSSTQSNTTLPPLPGCPSGRGLSVGRLPSTMDCNDILGTSNRLSISSTLLRDTLNVRDIVGSRRRPQNRISTSLSTQDIRGASPLKRTVERVRLGSGRASLFCGDIDGAHPGHPSQPCRSSFTGRWPQPAVAHWRFGREPRRTVLQRPLNMLER